MKTRLTLGIGFLTTVSIIGIVSAVSLGYMQKVSLDNYREAPLMIEDLIQGADVGTQMHLVHFYTETAGNTARNFAFTAAPGEEKEYKQYNSEIDELFKKIIKAEGGRFQPLAVKIQRLRNALFVFEDKAIHLTHENRSAEALNLLDGEEYQKATEDFRQELDKYFAFHHNDSAHSQDDALLKMRSLLHNENNDLKHSMAIVVLFALLAVALAFVKITFLAHSVTHPLEKLVKAAQKIKSGKFQEGIEEVKGLHKNNEMGELFRTFEEMAETLLKEDDIIRQKVDAQTQKLREKEEIAERLNEDLSKFQLAVENSSDNIFFMDPKGIIVYANATVRGKYGFTSEEIIGKNAVTNELWGGVMQPEFYELVWNTIRKQKKSFTGEYTDRGKEGKCTVTQISITPILDKQGEVKFHVLNGHDITKIREADKMKDEFVSIASHELRTPMTVIKGYVSLFREGTFGALTGMQKEYLEKIENNVTGLIGLVNDMLDLNKLEAGNMEIHIENINLDEYVSKILEDFLPLYVGKDLTLTYENAMSADGNNKTEIAADPYMLRRIFTNLLSNACKFTPRGGKVEITVAEYPDNPEFLLVSIKDTGEGIPAERLGEVFQKFSQVNNTLQRQQGGTGLGLAIVKSVIELLQGKVWVKSSPHEGSNFSFTLPLTKKAETDFIV